VSRRVVVRAVLLGAAAGLLAWVFGVQGVRPALIGVCVAAGVAAALGIPAGWYGTWPDRPHTAHGGGSAQVWRLANRLRRYQNDYDPALQHRLRSLATARLRRLGVDWDDPRAVRALGAGVHEALTQGTLRPSLRDVDAVVTAIERLDQHRTLDQPGEGARP
jgi:hypothetical protein